MESLARCLAQTSLSSSSEESESESDGGAPEDVQISMSSQAQAALQAPVDQPVRLPICHNQSVAPTAEICDSERQLEGASIAAKHPYLGYVSPYAFAEPLRDGQECILCKRRVWILACMYHYDTPVSLFCMYSSVCARSCW